MLLFDVVEKPGRPNTPERETVQAPDRESAMRHFGVPIGHTLRLRTKPSEGYRPWPNPIEGFRNITRALARDDESILTRI